MITWQRASFVCNDLFESLFKRFFMDLQSATRSSASRTSAGTLLAQRQTVGPATLLEHGMRTTPPSRITQSKWTEMLNEEVANRVINSIREEIVQTSMDIVHRKHLEYESCSFIVDCAHIAWLQLFKWMHLERDSAQDSTTVKQRWSNDEEHAPIPKDNWSFGNVEILKQPIAKQADCGEPCEQRDDARILPRNIIQASGVQQQQQQQQPSGEAKESVVPMVVPEPSAGGFPRLVNTEGREKVGALDDSTTDENGDEKEEQKSASDCTVRASGGRSEASSIFTKTVEAPRRELAIPKWPNGQRHHPTIRGSEIPTRKTLRWKLDGVKPPRKLSLDRLPANRLDVKYALLQDHAPTSSSPEDIRRRQSSRFAPKSVDIRLNREKKTKISHRDEKNSKEK